MPTFWMVGISLQYAVVDSSIHVISNLISGETWKVSIVSFAMIVSQLLFYRFMSESD